MTQSHPGLPQSRAPQHEPARVPTDAAAGSDNGATDTGRILLELREQLRASESRRLRTEDALERAEGELAEAQDTHRTELASLNAQLNQGKDTIIALQSERADIEKALTQIQGDLKIAAAARARLEQENSRFAVRVRELEGNSQEQAARVGRLTSEVRTLELQVAQRQGALAEARENLGRRDAEYAKLSVESARATELLNSTRAELADARSRIQLLSRETESARASFTRDLALAERRGEELTQAVAEVERERDRLRERQHANELKIRSLEDSAHQHMAGKDALAEQVRRANRELRERAQALEAAESRRVELQERLSLVDADVRALKHSLRRIQEAQAENHRRQFSLNQKLTNQSVAHVQTAARLGDALRRAKASTLVARDGAKRIRLTLSFQLGNALVMAARSWRALLRLPWIFWDLLRQKRAGLFKPRTLRLQAAREAYSRFEPVWMNQFETLMTERGPAAAEEYAVSLRHSVPDHRLARAFTALARHFAGQDYGEACRLGRKAVELDPRSFRNKWLAFLYFDAGNLTEAFRLLTLVRNEDIAKPSERHKAARIQGAYRLLVGGLVAPAPLDREAPLNGPVLYVAAASLPYHITGYTVRTHGLLSALRGLGQDFVCVTRPGYPDDRDDLARARPDSNIVEGIRYETLPGPHRYKVPLDEYFAESTAILVRTARRLNARAIHAASNHESAVPALMAARQLGIPFVYEVRGLWEYTAATKIAGWEQTEAFALAKKLETFAASEADAVLTLTNALRGELVARGVAHERIGLAPNAVDPDSYAPRPRDEELAREIGLAPDDFIVAYVGSVLRYEGVEDLVAAFPAVLADYPQAKLLIVGEGKALPELRELARDLGVDQRVVFVGQVTPEEAKRYYSLASVVALPRKPFTVCQLVSPLKPLEAMAMGVPLVVSDVRALKEMIRDGETGLIFPAGDVDALARQILLLARSSELRATLSRDARREVVRNRTWATVAQALVAAHQPAKRPAITAAPVTREPARPVVLPANRNSMSEQEKTELNEKLEAELVAGGVPALRSFVHRQCDGHSAQFRSFCELRAAQVCLASGRNVESFDFADTATTRDSSPSTLRAAARVFYNAADFERASKLVDQLEMRLSGSVSAGDQRFMKEVRARRELVNLCCSAPTTRTVPANPGRVLNVLAFSLPYSSVGYATRSHGLALGIQCAGWDIRPYTRPGFPHDHKAEWTDKKLPAEDDIDGITYRRCFGVTRDQATEIEYLLASIRLYEEILDQERPEIVHAASNYVTALPALIAARRRGIPFVYEIRGFWEVTRSSRDEQFENTPKYRFMELFEGLVARNADRVVTITTAMKRRLISHGVPEDRIDVAFNGVDPARFVPQQAKPSVRQKLGIPEGAPVIGYVGSFVDYEGLDDLVTAAAGLVKQGHDFRVLLVGDGGALPALRTQIANAGLSDIAILTGRVPYAEVEDLYALVDIAPFPRKPWEVCELVSPLKPFEAMALEKAVVVSSVEALSEIVTDGSNGLVFEKGNALALQHALAKLIADPALRTQLGRMGREWVIENRSWDASGKVCIEAYERVRATPSVIEKSARAVGS